MKKAVQKNLLGILEKAVRAEVERNEKNFICCNFYKYGIMYGDYVIRGRAGNGEYYRK